MDEHSERKNIKINEGTHSSESRRDRKYREGKEGLDKGRKEKGRKKDDMILQERLKEEECFGCNVPLMERAEERDTQREGKVTEP